MSSGVAGVIAMSQGRKVLEAYSAGLGTQLLSSACNLATTIVVLAGSGERVEHLDALLWTYDDASFLPLTHQ